MRGRYLAALGLAGLLLAAGAFAGDGKWIAAGSRAGQWDLFLLEPDGKTARQLTNSPEIERSAVCVGPNLAVVFTTSDGVLWRQEKNGSLRALVRDRNLDRLVNGPTGVWAVEHLVHGTAETSRLVLIDPQDGTVKSSIERNVPLDEPAMDAETGTLYYRVRLLGPSHQIADYAFSHRPPADDQLMAIDDGVLDRLVWSERRRQLLAIRASEAGSIITFSPQGATPVTADQLAEEDRLLLSATSHAALAEKLKAATKMELSALREIRLCR